MAGIDDIDLNDPDAGSQLRTFAVTASQKASEAEARAAELERKVALMEAGIDLSTRKGQAFAETFKGDIKSKDAILADAAEFDPTIIAGQSTPAATTTEGNNTATTTTEGTPTNEPTGTAERNALTDGANSGTLAPPDPVQASHDFYQNAIRSGAPQDTARAAAFAMQVQAKFAEINGN